MYLEFVQQNWYLFLALAVILVLLAVDPLQRRSSGARSISALELPRIVRHQSGVVLDVSDVADFRGGHIANAINIPLKELSSQLNRLNKYKKAPIVITCRNGMQSGKAASVLRKNDFTGLYTLHGGISAWVKENFPLEKK